MLSKEERSLIRAIGAEAFIIDGEMDDFGDEVIAALAAHRILLFAICRTVLTSSQQSTLTDIVRQLVDTVTVRNVDAGAQEKIQALISKNVLLCKAAAPARG